jgi:hypothetical protein
MSMALLPVSGRCQASKTVAQFLLLAPDARGKSLGEGGSVFSTGAISAYYNPALLVTTNEISGEYGFYRHLPKLTGDSSVRNAYISSKLDDLVYLGIGYSRLSYGKQVRTDEFGRDLGTFESYDYAVGFWAALTFDPHNSVGVGIKIIESHLAEVGAGSERGKGTASTFAFDFGILSRNHLPETTWPIERTYSSDFPKLLRAERNAGFSFGLSLANLGKGLDYVNADQTDPLPRRLRLGFGFQAINTDPVGLQLTIDATKVMVGNSNIVWSFGLESELYYIFVFRFGRLHDDDGHQRYNTIGLGVGPEWLRFEYSYVLDSDITWNRKGDESSYSINCNISPRIFEGDK